MLQFIGRRLLQAIPILFGVTLVCFALVRLAPGSIVDVMVPPGAPPELIDHITRMYGLDRPIYEQYVLWLAQIAQGNFGTSMVSGRPIGAEILAAGLATLQITLFAAVLGFFLGVLFGSIAALCRGRWPDRVFSLISIAGVSIPQYWLAVLMVVILSVELNLLPAQGIGPAGFPLHWNQWRFMILPIVTLALIPMGAVGRLVRASVLEILSQEFVAALAARGLGPVRVYRHVAKNAAPPVLALMGLEFGYLLGGSILVETVFNWPGTGQLPNQAIFQHDLTVVQGAILVLAFLFVMVNLGVDILQAAIDPRMRR